MRQSSHLQMFQLVCLCGYMLQLTEKNVVAVTYIETEDTTCLKDTDVEIIEREHHVVYGVNYITGTYLLSISYGHGTQCQVFVGLKSTSLYITILCNSDYLLENTLVNFDLKKYTYIWIAWGDGKFQVGKGSNPHRNTIKSVTLTDAKFLEEIQSICFKGKCESGCIFYDPLPFGTTVKTLAKHNKVNITSGVVWREKSESLGKCAFLCFKSVLCVSYTYNQNRCICQGHDSNFRTLDNVHYIADEECVYYA